MRLSSLLAWAFLAFFPVSATRLIRSNSLNLCQESSNFTATYFSAVFTPDNKTLTFSLNGVTQISGYVLADVNLAVYGYNALKKTLDPCSIAEAAGFCPMNAGQLKLENSPIPLPGDVLSHIPSKALSVATF